MANIMMARTRIDKELREILQKPDINIFIDYKTINYKDAFRWNIIVLGEKNTPYEGGIFTF